MGQFLLAGNEKTVTVLGPRLATVAWLLILYVQEHTRVHSISTTTLFYYNCYYYRS